MKCDTTADVDAAFIYTNAVLAFFPSTGGKESDAAASTSDFTATSAPSISASTACSEELPVVQSKNCRF